MKIIVASVNKAKIRAVKKLFIGAEVKSKRADSEVSRKPVNQDVFKGAYNRAKNLQLSQKDGLVITLEDGYLAVNGKYYLATVCCIKNNRGFRTGCGTLHTISENMFKLVIKGHSLSDIVSSIMKQQGDNCKGKVGVLYFITHGELNRVDDNMEAIKNALNSPIKDSYETNLKRCRTLNINTDNYKLLDKACEQILISDKEKEVRL